MQMVLNGCENVPKLQRNLLRKSWKTCNKNLITVDLPEQIISCGSEININFDIDPFRKKCLLEGLDDIALTLKKSEKIDDYELKLNKSRSWLMI